MKKKYILFLLLFIGFYAQSAPPEKLENEEKSENNFPALPSKKLNLDDNFIYPAWGFYFDVSPGISGIINSEFNSSFWDLKKGFGYTFNVGYFQSLSPWIKIKMGVGISSYMATLSANGDVAQKSFTDIDSDTYTETLTLNNTKKELNPMYISAPFIFEFGNPNINKLGFYGDIGIKYSYLISENYSTTGTYSTKGTYEQWEVTLEDVPELGFFSNKNLGAESSIKKSNISILAGAGIFIPVSSSIIFKGGLVTNIGISDIGNNSSETNKSDVINNEVYKYRKPYIDNTFAVTKGSKTFHLGIEFGLYISHRLK